MGALVENGTTKKKQDLVKVLYPLEVQALWCIIPLFLTDHYQMIREATMVCRVKEVRDLFQTQAAGVFTQFYLKTHKQYYEWAEVAWDVFGEIQTLTVIQRDLGKDHELESFTNSWLEINPQSLQFSK